MKKLLLHEKNRVIKLVVLICFMVLDSTAAQASVKIYGA